MTSSSQLKPRIEYNKKPLVVPLLLLVVGTLMLFFAPDPVVQLFGGILAFLGLLVGFVLTTIIISFHMPRSGNE